MMKMTSAKVEYLYDVMASAYDAGQIYEASKKLDHVPLIDRNPRGGEAIPKQVKGRFWSKEYNGQREKEGKTAPDVWHHSPLFRPVAKTGDELNLWHKVTK